MTIEDRSTILEVVDLLRTIGGQNGFCNLRPQLKKLLLRKANDLNKIVEREIKQQDTAFKEFTGETVYESDPEDFKIKNLEGTT